MRKSFVIIILALVASLTSAQTSQPITFVVDENLSPSNSDLLMERFLTSGSKALSGIFEDEGVPGDVSATIAWSFSDDEKFYTFAGKDVFFKTIVRAYAQHRPLVLSPDMIWVLISQGFARYVNAHSEELRDQIVSHTEKMQLVVESDKELLTEGADWEKMIGEFAAKIGDNTKGDIAKTITADFSTTGTTERITSQITLMETMKSYFDYVVVYLACGIPSITLTGTPQDWQKVMEKTKQLEKYGIGEWTKSLEPILKEFVEASKGNPNQRFWKQMVKKKRVDKLAGGGCDPSDPTELDGWILKFFPDENGHTLDKVPHTHKMPAERVYVDFIYKIINPTDGTIVLETPLQLIAGFIGTEVDTQTHALTPKMGWVVRQMASNDSIVKKLQAIDNQPYSDGINLRVSEVPDFLSKLPHIKRLTLHFTNEVELPEWFYDLKIDNLTIRGEMSDEQEATIRKHFRKADIRRPAPKNGEPLIIVDGMHFNGKLSDINRASIKQMNVLKDARATAFYGSQGANGVIEITTKKPASGKKSKKTKTVKYALTISGTVSDELGPLFGANVVEVDEKGSFVGFTITDDKGNFTLKVQNTHHKIRFYYVGMKTVTLDVSKEKYKVMMYPSEMLEPIPIESKTRVGNNDSSMLIFLNKTDNP